MNKQKCGKENAKGPVFKVRRLSRVIGRYSDIMQLKDCFHLYNKPNSLSIIARLFINTINAGYLHVKICRLATLNLAWIRGLGKPPEIGVIGPLYTSPGWFLARFESSQSADVQTEKTGYLTASTNRVNPSLKKGYPARGTDSAWLLFSCKRL